MSLDVNISEPDEFRSDELHNYLKEVSKINGIEDFEYQVEYICGRSDNFISNLFKVTIHGTSACENNKFDVVVKTLVNTIRQELFHELHKREVLFYNAIVSKYEALQLQLREEQRLYLPKCFLSSSEKGKEILILEDLTDKNFKMDHKLRNYENVTYDSVHLAMINLAKFHALSFVMKVQEPEVFNEIKNKFPDIVYETKFLDKSKLRNYIQESFEKSLKVVRNLEAVKKLEQIENNLLSVLSEFVKPGKYTVFCHGDFWIHNMLFQNDSNGSPQKVCFIDYQTVRLANPVTDILYFIYLCTDSEFRLTHFRELLEIYYNSFKSFLSLFDISTKTIYPREDFEDDIKDFMPFGLLVALIQMRVITKHTDDDSVLKGSNLALNFSDEEPPGENNIFVERVNQVVNEFMENGVLQNDF